MAGTKTSITYNIKNSPMGTVGRFDNGHPTWFDQRGDLFYMELSRETRRTDAEVPQSAKVTDFQLEEFNYNNM